MNKAIIVLRCSAALAAILIPASLFANLSGADPRLTGAPGDDPMSCASCHSGALNSGAGSVKIELAGGATYAPGVKQRVKVTVTDAGMRRWGFSLSDRVNSNAASGQAGTLASVDANTRVFCDDGNAAPCRDPNMVQFITHTMQGTRNGTTGGVDFELDWTPPSTDVGPVTLYAAGNAANGNGQNSGDRIYTAKLEVAPAAGGAAPKPAISSERGVASAAATLAGLAPNSWFAITGTNLASVTRSWTAEEIASGKLPDKLENVSVTVNGKAAFVNSVSPVRVVALAPADDARGDVEVVLSSGDQKADTVTAKLAAFAPALFAAEGKFVVSTKGDAERFLRPEQMPSDKATDPVTPGEAIVLYGTAFGATDPDSAAGELAKEESKVKAAVTVTIGGVPATVAFAGLAANSASVFQLRVAVPEGLADGDHPVVVQVEDVKSPEAGDCCLLKVRK